MYNLGIILFARGTTPSNSNMKGASKPSSSSSIKRARERQNQVHSHETVGETFSKGSQSKKSKDKNNNDDDESYVEVGMKKVGDVWKWLNGELKSNQREFEIHEAMEWLKLAASKGSQYAQDKLEEHALKLKSDNELMKLYSYSYDRHQEEDNEDEL